MTNEETICKLIEMKMSAMADSYKLQMNNHDYQDMTFEERFNLLVDYEYSRRQSNKLQRLISQSQFNEPSAAIEILNITLTIIWINTLFLNQLQETI